MNKFVSYALVAVATATLILLTLAAVATATLILLTLAAVATVYSRDLDPGAERGI